MALAERFKGMDLKPFYAQLQSRGNELGIVFNEHEILSNSLMALKASEYARDMGRYDAFHENMFRAYFTESLISAVRTSFLLWPRKAVWMKKKHWPRQAAVSTHRGLARLQGKGACWV